MPRFIRTPSISTWTFVFAGAAALWLQPLAAQMGSERLSDKDVKTLIEQVDTGRDKFEGNLDGAFKGSTVRGPRGETKVSGALQDYQDNTQKLKERFTPEYAASAEVSTVLTQSALIDQFMQTQPATMKGRSEWLRQVAMLKQLATAYGATFPAADGAAVRRMNDKETAAAAEAMAEAADHFKSDVDKTTLAPPDKTAVKKEAELLAKQANTVKSRTSDGKPASAEMRQLLVQASALRTSVVKHTIPSTTNWQAMQTSLAKLQQAFGLAQ